MKPERHSTNAPDALAIALDVDANASGGPRNDRDASTSPLDVFPNASDVSTNASDVSRSGSGVSGIALGVSGNPSGVSRNT
jgi:hypothetical protein